MYYLTGFHPSELTTEELLEWDKVKNLRIAGSQFQQYIVEKRQLQRMIISIQGERKKAVSLTPVGVATNYSAHQMADHQILNGRQGHGYAAERLNHQHDLSLGKNAKIVGGGNLKNGPDRVVDGVPMQTKYCQSPESTISDLFHDDAYRYLNSDGKAMICEVPKDQYKRVVKLMEKKITEGKVPGFKNPDRAHDLVREGHFTYAQAANMALPGTWESLKYDATTGVVICTYAAGISAAVTFLWCLHDGADFGDALAASLKAGSEIFGVTLISHIAVQQLGRTAISEMLNRPAAALTIKLPQSARNFLAEGVASGSSVNNATTTVLKAIKGHIIATGVTTAVLSVKDTIRLCNGEISGVQFVKNVTVVAGNVGGGAGGAWAGRSLAVALGFTGPIGLIAGLLLGGMAGSALGGSATKYIVDQIADDDVVKLKKIFFEQMKKVVTGFMMTNTEIRDVLHPILQKQDWNKIYYKMHASNNWVNFAEEWCEDVCGPIIFKRKLVLV
jgi:hypothetical protein